MKPIVAIVGRPNVGKSTLFNRITRKRDALVDNRPGVTRDRHYADANWDDVVFTLVDTGGFSDDDQDKFSSQIRFQVHQAIDDADAVILVLDGKGGISPFDADMIKMFRSVSIPVFYAVNKIDGEEQEERLNDFYGLGIDSFFPISAEHGYGISDFLDKMVLSLPKSPLELSEEMINLAVVGRPNVGKSSLINRILGEDKHLVSALPGTTRDAVDSIFNAGTQTYRLIDTAGIRRKGRVKKKIEKFSIIKALRSLEACDVALIVFDADEGITDQDITVAGYAYDRGCGCIFVINKWDLVKKDHKTVNTYYDQVRMSAKYLNFAPVITISALTGLRVQKILSLVDSVFEQYTKRIGTGVLNRIIEKAITNNEPSLYRGRRLKFYYSAQVSVRPPTFVCFVNYPGQVHFSYKRYLVNQIREKTGLDMTPIRLYFRLRTGRIEFGRKKKGKKGSGRKG